MSAIFRSQRALVTGAGAGIGRATALRLAERGAKVFALSKTQANLDSLKAENPDIETVCVDLADWDATRQAVKNITPINLLVNNAALAFRTQFMDVQKDELDLLYEVNVKSVINVSQVVASQLIEKKLTGKIVNVSSILAQQPMVGATTYSSTKAALDAITKSMAKELSPEGIRVNAISPTIVIETAMGQYGFSKPEEADPVLSRTPQGRFAKIVEILNGIEFLLSDNSEMINGHMLPVDGGYLAA